MAMDLDLIDGKTINEITKYLDNHDDNELSSLIDDIKDSLGNDIYPRELIYKAQDIFKQIKQIQRIKELNQRLELELRDTDKLINIRSRIKRKRKGSHK